MLNIFLQWRFIGRVGYGVSNTQGQHFTSTSDDENVLQKNICPSNEKSHTKFGQYCMACLSLQSGTHNIHISMYMIVDFMCSAVWTQYAEKPRTQLNCAISIKHNLKMGVRPIFVTVVIVIHFSTVCCCCCFFIRFLSTKFCTGAFCLRFVMLLYLTFFLSWHFPSLIQHILCCFLYMS